MLDDHAIEETDRADIVARGFFILVAMSRLSRQADAPVAPSTTYRG